MINKEKILAGVRTCITPNLAICQDCPYWNDGDKQCEELRMDIVEAIDSGVFAPKYSPRIAKWIPVKQYSQQWGINIIHYYECSNCKHLEHTNSCNYCSYCGAKIITEGE